MIKYICLIMLISIVVFTQQKLSFERAGGIYTANTDGSNVKKALDGYQHSISPDGMFISFTYYEGSKRYAGVYDIASGKTTKYPAESDGNSFYPVFSPDGSFIAFHDYVNKSWQIAIADISKNIYTIVSDQSRKDGYCSPRWSLGSKTILCHDLNYVYEFDLHGTLINKFNPLQMLLQKNINLSNNCCFVYNKDKSALIFDNTWDYESVEKSNMGIYRFDIKSNTVSLFSPADMICGAPFVDFSSGKVYFDGNYKKDIKLNDESELVTVWNVYSINEDGTELKKIITDGYYPTVSQ